MRTKKLVTLFAAAMLLALCAGAASAQVVTASGRVTLKQADGTEAPLPGATVTFYRTDIRGEYTVKTDKNGRYVRAGLPLVGTFIVAISGPGARPDYIRNLRLINKPENDIHLEPGDGSMLTLDQIKAASAGGPTTAAAAAAPVDAAAAAAAKRRADELAAERARLEAENMRARELNTKLPEILKAGNDAFTAKRYDDAIAQYDLGILADPAQGVFYRNKAAALRARGVERFNTAARAKDQPGKEAARADFKAAAENAEKAVMLYREAAARRAGGGAAAAGAGAQPVNDELGYLADRAEAYRIAMQTITPIDNDAAVKAIQEYISAETDEAKKAKMQASLGDAMFASGKIDEAIAVYRMAIAANPGNLDALRGLGIALAAQDQSNFAQARDMLQQFVSKAPDTDARKQEAVEMVKYLDDTLKSATNKPADKPKPTNTRRRP